MKKNEVELNATTQFLGFISKFLICFIIGIELLFLIGLPTFLNEQKFAPLKFEKQKTTILINQFQQQINTTLEKDKQNISYPLIVEINNRLNKLKWILKNERYEFAISYFKDVQKNIFLYQKNLPKLNDLLDVKLENINKDKLIKSVL